MIESEGKPWPFDKDTDREDWLRWAIAFTFIIAILLYRYGLLKNRPKTAPQDGSQLSQNQVKPAPTIRRSKLCPEAN
jgi:hypothetical protein